MSDTVITIDDLIKQYPHLDRRKLIDNLRTRGVELSEDRSIAFLVNKKIKQ